MTTPDIAERIDAELDRQLAAAVERTLETATAPPDEKWGCGCPLVDGEMGAEMACRDVPRDNVGFTTVFRLTPTNFWASLDRTDPRCSEPLGG